MDFVNFLFGLAFRLVPGAILGVIMGKLTNKVLHYKGYYSEDWFWLGFFFSPIPILIAAFKPKVDLETREQQRKIGEEALLKNNGWRCKKCGTVNVESARACSCCRTPKPAEDGEVK